MARLPGDLDDGFVARLVELAGDDDLLTEYVDGRIPYGKPGLILARLTKQANLHPVFFGSAVTGAGIGDLLDGISRLLPAAGGDPQAEISGTVFKIERSGVAYVRLFDGTLKIRDHLAGGVVTAIETATGRREARAGEIARVHGLRGIRIGDSIGRRPERAADAVFAPPTLQTEVVPRDEHQRAAVHDALAELAEQDPLIDLRPDLTVSLYGEVQKEVIEATLAEEYGLAVTFRETTARHVERPCGIGVAGETVRQDGNPYFATLELRVEPGEGFVLDLPIEQVPTYLFRNADLFREALETTARQTLGQGLHGWPVIDARIAVTRAGYTAPITTAADFRKLLPLVLMAALKIAGTVVHEPIQRFELDGPADTLGAVLGALGRFGAVPESSEPRGDAYVIGGVIPAARLRDLELALPGLTRGEGVVETTFDGYRPVTGPPPTRPRWDDNPLDRAEYLLRVERRVAVRQVSDTSA